jgi:hypothetical protein
MRIDEVFILVLIVFAIFVAVGIARHQSQEASAALRRPETPRAGEAVAEGPAIISAVQAQPVRVAMGPIIGAIILANILSGVIGAFLYMIVEAIH